MTMPYTKARNSRRFLLPVAEYLLAALAPACEKAEIAGSLRRGKEDVGDIEIVCQPIRDIDLFDGEAETSEAFDNALDNLIRRRFLSWDEETKRNGTRYKRLRTTGLDGRSGTLDVVVELWLPRRENWGNILAIRTGDADFTALLVTKTVDGGLMPPGMRQQDGFLWRDADRLSCETEEQFFANLGVTEPPPPEKRDRSMAVQLARDVRLAREAAAIKAKEQTKEARG